MKVDAVAALGEPSGVDEVRDAPATRTAGEDRGHRMILAMSVAVVGAFVAVVAWAFTDSEQAAEILQIGVLVAVAVAAGAAWWAAARTGVESWRLLALSLVVLVVPVAHDLIDGADRAFPSWTDAVVLIGAPALWAALLLVGYHGARRVRRLRVLTEALAVAPALVFLFWVAATAAWERVAGLERLELLGGLGLVFTFLAGFVIAALAFVDHRGWSRFFVAVGLAGLAIGSSVRTLGWATEAGSEPAWVAGSWIAGLAALCLGALHATGRPLARPAAPRVHSLLVYVPVAAAFVIGLIEVVWVDELSRIEVGLLAATGVLAVGNQLLVLLDNGRLTESLRTNLRDLAVSERRFRLVLAELADGVAVAAADGRLTEVGGRLPAMLRADADELIGRSVFDFVHPEDIPTALRAFALARDGGRRGPVTLRLRRSDGELFWAEIEAGSYVEDSALGGLIVSVRDLTGRLRQEAATREAEERFRVAFQNAPIGMALATPEGELIEVNAALERMLGHPPDRLVGRTLGELVLAEDWRSGEAEMARVAASQTGSHRMKLRFQHANGSVVLGDTSLSVVGRDDGRRYLITQVEDVTREHAIAERLAYSARHDELTGLLNRQAFMERLASALIRRRPEEVVGVVFVDIDRLKVINDSLGHAAGDRVLRTVSSRLRDAAGEPATLARFGGDEFCAFVTAPTDDDGVESLADRLLRAVAQPMPVGDGSSYVSASVGISVADRNWVTAESLVRDADAAMYQAKQRGRNRVERFDPAARASMVRLHQIANDLHRALERDEFALVFQPIVSLRSGRLAGFETLVRWMHPQRGALPPADFLEVAEETGLIVAIGEVVLHKSLDALARWSTRFEPEHGVLRLSVNVSPRQLAEPAFVDILAGAIAQAGVDPAQVWIEITEGALIADVTLTTEVLSRVRALGVGIVIDDFGTGYSSLSYLQRLPVQGLKIDQSFVKGLRKGSDNAAIIQAITQLAHSLGLSVTAEGVETVSQLVRLRELGCDMAQGLLVGPPQAAEAVDRGLPAWEAEGGLVPAGAQDQFGEAVDLDDDGELSAEAANPSSTIPAPAIANTATEPHAP